MPRSNLVETVLRQCRADPVVPKNPRIVVAVSGGPDSTALLHALSRAAPRLRLQLTAAHLDHALRRTSAADARRVEALCISLRVPLVTRREAPATNSEDAARSVRYRFLEEVATDLGAGTICLGHTADDQAETVLLHLVRGSGLEGLAAMQVREGLRFRPLLSTWRESVEEHCRRHHLSTVDDRSNRSPRFTRNRIRRRVIPLLETINPQVRASLVRLAEAARAEHEVVAGEAASWLAGQGDDVDRRDFRALPIAVAVEALRRLWSRSLDGGPLPGDARRLEQAVRLVCSDRRAGMLNLGLGLSLHVSEDGFRIAATRPR